MNSPHHLTIPPPPNPLAAMTSLSYSASPSTHLTNSSANIGKDDKNTTKSDDTHKAANDLNVLVSTTTSHTVTTGSNGSITISSATSKPITSLVSINKQGKLTLCKQITRTQKERKFNEIIIFLCSFRTT